MSKTFQLRRGTAAQHNSFIGAEGELTVDTTNKNLRVHDGVTLGGKIVDSKTVYVDNYGALGDWNPATSTGSDDTAAFQAAANYLATIGGGVIVLSAKHYRIAGTISLNAPITLVGQGFEDIVYPRVETCPVNGTWMIHDSNNPMIQSGNANCSGSGMDQIAVFETGHPVGSTVGWTPANRNYVIAWNTFGCRWEFGRVHFHGVNRGALFDSCARVNLGQISGQFFTVGVLMDRIYDSGYGDWIRAWTYRYESTPVLQYTQANASVVSLLRVDGLAINHIFGFATRETLYVGKSGYTEGGGTARVIQVESIYADFTGRALTVTGETLVNAEITIGTIFHLGQAWPVSPVTYISGACTVLIESGSNSVVNVGYLRMSLVPAAAVANQGSGQGNIVEIGSAYFTNYDYVNGGNGAVSTSTNNIVRFAQDPVCVAAGGGEKLTSINTGQIVSNARVIESIGADNDPIFYNSQGNNPVELKAVGPNNVDLLLTGSGTGMVRFGTKTTGSDAAIIGYVSHKLQNGEIVKLAIIA